MKLSENFTLAEMIASETAQKKGIDNTPNEEQIANLHDLVDNCLQRIRTHFGKPLIVTSGFRCEELNKVIGGSKTSDHRNGCAADFTVKDVPNVVVLEWCRKHLEYDQLIDEYGIWIHISFRKFKNRNECLVASRNAQGRAIYKPYEYKFG